MDLFPLWNSLRVAVISAALAVILGIYLARAAAKMPAALRGIFDAVLTLPLVLPPTVIGFFLLKIFGPRGIIGSLTSIKLAMVWYSAIFSGAVVAFPLMYRACAGAFSSVDGDIQDAARTLGKRGSWVFWRVTVPNAKAGIIAGAILAFARALGEYGATSMLAGYTPGRTATISTTVYQLWRAGNDAEAYTWAGVNIAISAVVLIALNFVENRGRKKV
ncbi:MAG: molybdate ABC transporter permease subunit [Oscillospiraceae bacterium]|nr:molybdate ABC transporter permease subunit [Oscillospiraceae bacterium]